MSKKNLALSITACLLLSAATGFSGYRMGYTEGQTQGQTSENAVENQMDPVEKIATTEAGMIGSETSTTESGAEMADAAAAGAEVNSTEAGAEVADAETSTTESGAEVADADAAGAEMSTTESGAEVADAEMSTTESGAATPAEESQEVTRFENGFYENENGIHVVNLYGSWQEMGRQYGALLKDQLTYIFEEELYKPVKDNPDGYAKMVQTAAKMYQNYPEKFKDFFEGMSETTGMTVEQLTLNNAVESIYTVETTEEPNCSGIAVWGDYAADKLVYGRNYDYGEIFQEFKDFLALTIYHPSDGSAATATVGYVGEIYCVNGLNENGIFIELNNGSKSSSKKAANRLVSIGELLELELDATDIEYADHFFDTVGCSSSYLIGVADKDSARSYEWCVDGAKRGDVTTPEGLMIQTNHFVNEEWDFATPDDEDAWFSLTRRDNLLNLAETNKGNIDAEKMKEILSTRIEDGGPTEDLTIYQIVAIPEDLTLWIKVINGADWTRFDMEKYFQPQAE